MEDAVPEVQEAHTFGALFAQLGQPRRPKPQHLSWAKSIEREFGVNPLHDSQGSQMHLVARRSPSPNPMPRTDPHRL